MIRFPHDQRNARRLRDEIDGTGDGDHEDGWRHHPARDLSGGSQPQDGTSPSRRLCYGQVTVRADLWRRHELWEPTWAVRTCNLCNQTPSAHASEMLAPAQIRSRDQDMNGMAKGLAAAFAAAVV